MGEFFKQLFQPFQRQWLEQRKRSNMDELIISFAETHFGKLCAQLPKKLQFEFTQCVLVVVHSHRHNKNEEFLNDENLDFATVRETMYKYSKKAQGAFFANPMLAYLYAWFAENNDTKQFVVKKYQAKGKEYCMKILEEITILKQEAAQAMKGSGFENALKR